MMMPRQEQEMKTARRPDVVLMRESIAAVCAPRRASTRDTFTPARAALQRKVFIRAGMDSERMRRQRRARMAGTARAQSREKQKRRVRRAKWRRKPHGKKTMFIRHARHMVLRFV